MFWKKKIPETTSPQTSTNGDRSEVAEIPIDKMETIGYDNRWCPRCHAQMTLMGTEETKDQRTGLRVTLMNWGCDCLTVLPNFDKPGHQWWDEPFEQGGYNKFMYPPTPTKKEPEEDLTADQLKRRAYFD